MSDLSHVRVVLVRPSHPGNIGAAARSMANMGLSDLVLVSPKEFPSAEATARAASAGFILETVKVVDTLSQALEGCSMVVASSARQRAIEWQNLDSDSMAHLITDFIEKDNHNRAAIVFGPEKTGLSNEDIDKCQYLVRLPVDDSCTSINLGTAVALLTWEVRRVWLAQQGNEKAVLPVLTSPDRPNMPDQPRMELFFEHLESTLEEAGFFINKPPTKLMRKIRQVFMRGAPDNDELNILRGILTHFQHILRNEPSNNWPFDRQETDKSSLAKNDEER